MEIIINGAFRDRRLEARGNQIVQAIGEKKTAIANRYCRNATEAMGNRRFVSNPRIENPKIQEALYDWRQQQGRGNVVLDYQDSTEFDYQSHAGRLSKKSPDLGPVGNGRDIGFFVYLVLVVDAENAPPGPIPMTRGLECF